MHTYLLNEHTALYNIDQTINKVDNSYTTHIANKFIPSSYLFSIILSH